MRRASSAHVTTLRHACGLTLDATANLVGSTLRAVQRWEQGRNHAPTAAVAKLHELDAMIRDLVDENLVSIRASRTNAPVILRRYRTLDAYEARCRFAALGLPHQSHNAMLARMVDALARLGIPYVIEWDDHAA